ASGWLLRFWQTGGRSPFPRIRSRHPLRLNLPCRRFHLRCAGRGRGFLRPFCAGSFLLPSESLSGSLWYPGSGAVCPALLPVPSAAWKELAGKDVKTPLLRKCSVLSPRPENIVKRAIPFSVSPRFVKPRIAPYGPASVIPV